VCIGSEFGCCDAIRRRRPGVGGVPPFETECVQNESEKCEDYASGWVLYLNYF
jgi:hypothetical protein